MWNAADRNAWSILDAKRREEIKEERSGRLRQKYHEELNTTDAWTDWQGTKPRLPRRFWAWACGNYGHVGK